MSERFIGKYEIVTTLGKGSMGVVYKARDPEIGRIVAIKTLKSMVMGNDEAGDEALQRFRQESRSAGMLHHPNIVTIFEAGKTDNGSPYIVMEYIEGDSFEQMIAEHAALEPLEVLHYLAQVASAIDYAHSQNVIHRDIKPSNVIVGSGYRPYLVDFGVAKLADTSLTPAGTVVGTPSYMSPEQIRGMQLDGRTDIFSLAVVAFELFTGVRPYPGKDFTTVVTNIMHKEPRTFAELDVALPPALEVELQHGLAKDREERFSTALSMIHSFAQVFSVLVDGSGIVGGYQPGLRLSGSETQASGAGSSFAQKEKPTLPVNRENSAATPNPRRSAAAQSLHNKSASKQSKGSTWLYAVGILGLIVGGGFFAYATMQSPEKRAGMNQVAPQETATQETATQETVPQDRATQDRATQDRATQENGDSGFNKLVQNSLVSAEPQKNEGITTNEERDALDDASAPQPERQASQSQPPREDVEVASAVETDSREQSESIPKPSVNIPREPSDGFSASTLGSVSDEVLRAMAHAELHSNSLRALAAEYGSRGSGAFVDELLVLLAHDQFAVRVAALKSLRSDETLSQSKVRTALADCLDDSEYLVRGFAAKVLGQLDAPEVRKQLQQRLAKEDHPVVKKVLTQVLSGS